MKTPVPSKPGGGLLARILPGLVVAVLAGALTFYGASRIVADDVEELEVAVAAHSQAGHIATVRELGELRVDIGRLVEKVSAANVADSERHERLDDRLGRIERALDR